MTPPDSSPGDVGSVTEEAVKLFHALSEPIQSSIQNHDSDACTATWCPICQVRPIVQNIAAASAKPGDDS